jgi:hypothetical protein
MAKKVKNLENVVQAAFDEYQRELDAVNSSLAANVCEVGTTKQEVERKL